MTKQGIPADGPVKMRDIARALDLSISTVSRALSQPHLLSPETVTRVRDEMTRSNYRVNLTARDLRTQATRTALVVVPSFSPFFLEIFRGAEMAAIARGYTALLAYTDRDPAQERRFIEQVLSQRADGLVLVTSSDPAALLDRSFAPPIVAALDEIEGLDVPVVRIDNVAAAHAATAHLIALGHNRIAHIGGPPGQIMARHRAEGFAAAIAAAGLDPAHCPILSGDFTVASGDDAMSRMLTRYPRPTAVFAANDEVAVGAIQAAHREGLDVPADMSIIGFDDQRIGSLNEPPLTTVAVPKAECGALAMERLLTLLNGEAVSSPVTVLPTELLVRRTTAPPRMDDAIAR